jgi:hypothetical protein
VIHSRHALGNCKGGKLVFYLGSYHDIRRWQNPCRLLLPLFCFAFRCERWWEKRTSSTSSTSSSYTWYIDSLAPAGPWSLGRSHPIAHPESSAKIWNVKRAPNEPHRLIRPLFLSYSSS